MFNNLRTTQMEISKSIIKIKLKKEKNLEKKINIFALYIDASLVKENIEVIDYLIDEIYKFREKNKAKLSSEQRSILAYFTANLWMNGNNLLKALTEVNEIILHRLKLDARSYNKEKALFSLREAHNEFGFHKLPIIRKCQILTNTGNILSEMGRVIEAIEYWETALTYNPNFTMAQGNKTYALYKYSQLIYDNCHKNTFLFNIKKQFENLNRDETIHDDNWNIFVKIKNYVSQLTVGSAEHINWDDFDLGSKKESEYRNWALNNKLFLNPLNDLKIKSYSARDTLVLPTIVTNIDTGNIYHGFFNQIKQEFVSTRYILFSGIKSDDTHFSDRDVILYNTLDYASLSLNIEKVKLAYRSCYSIIDKIALFLASYYKLDFGKKDINISMVVKAINSKTYPRTNVALKAIEWLEKDINEDRYQKYLDPDTKLLRMIRNKLEHGYIKITDMGDFEGVIKEKNGINDNLAYHISRDKFNDKSVKLIKIVRSLILYLLFTINIEEKLDEPSKKKITIPMYIDTIDDDWKI